MEKRIKDWLGEIFTGCELKDFILGRRRSPRCFKHVDLSVLGATYNRNACVDKHTYLVCG